MNQPTENSFIGDINNLACSDQPDIFQEFLDCRPGKTAIDAIHLAGVITCAVDVLQDRQQSDISPYECPRILYLIFILFLHHSKRQQDLKPYIRIIMVDIRNLLDFI